MKGQAFRQVAWWVAVVALAGMAYCHVEDLGMKLEESICYMSSAQLLSGNIAASLLLISVFVVARVKRSARLQETAWAAAGVLAGLTILGFVFSRTAGFPNMEDHVGEWDSLGLASLVLLRGSNDRREHGGAGGSTASGQP